MLVRRSGGLIEAKADSEEKRENAHLARPFRAAGTRLKEWSLAFTTVCVALESLVSCAVMNLSKALQAQPKALVFVEALVLVLLIGVLDSIGGWDVSMFLFYALPILIVVWFGNRRLAILCAIICGVVWFWAKKDTHPYGTPHAYAWATFNRMAYFLFVAIGGTAMKTQREEIRARMEALMRASELEQEIVRVSEYEQMRIGQDLHDGLCQNLAAIDCAAACLKADLKAKSLPEAEAAEVIQKLLREAVVEARDLARGIFPVQMDAEGLPAAMEELVATTNRLRQVTVVLEIHGDVKVTDPQIGMHLYRIAQQALNNALTHAEASRVAIRLSQEDTRLIMSIIDNGCGFTHGEVPSRGMGLRTMHYRARLIGAELVMESLPSAGTEVRCTLTFPDGSNS
jgi:signal transduction histidine kinase